jgi:aconitate hydratase
MGVLPLLFPEGQSYESLGLDGSETYDITGLAQAIERDFEVGNTVHVTATRADGSKTEFDATSRIDTPNEVEYYRNGGILHYVLRSLMKAA